ncbi:hypothetical protein LTR06_011260 [Exophiala xenobiotica]|nr:hypothetical protein LTR06_011260 [Exophiala xenobiotica]
MHWERQTPHNGIAPRHCVLAFERQFTGINQQEDQIVIQEDELNFTTIPGSSREQTESGCRQIIAFAMRNFLEIPQESVNRDVTVRPRTMALEERAVPPVARESSVPVLVTSGPGEKLQQRCGLPIVETFQEDREFLFLRHLHRDQDQQGEGITSFFVLKAIYLAFLGPPTNALVFNSLDLDNDSTAHLTQLDSEREAREREAQGQEAQ